MVLLSDIRDWLKTLGVGDHFYAGKLDNKKERSIGVYSRKVSGPSRMTIGGIQNMSYDIKHISVLLHWNRNAAEAEEAALLLFEKLRAQTNFEIGQAHVQYLQLMVPEPQDVGTDDGGVYERVIWFDLYYERTGE